MSPELSLVLSAVALLLVAVIAAAVVYGSRTRRPQGPPTVYNITRHDIEVLHTAGLTLEGWLTLSDKQRADYRESHVRTRR